MKQETQADDKPYMFSHAIIKYRIAYKFAQLESLLQAAPARLRAKYSFLKRYSLTVSNYFDEIGKLDEHISKLINEMQSATE